MSRIPIIVVHTSVPGVLYINGIVVGEVDGYASMPVSSTGDVFINFFPYGSFIPATLKVPLLNGHAQTVDAAHEITVWPDAVIEVELEIKDESRFFPPRVIDSAQWRGYVATLVKHGGLRLAVERGEDDETVYTQDFSGAATGSLRILDSPGEFLAILTFSDDKEKKTLTMLAEQGGKVIKIFESQGDRLHLTPDGRAITSVENLMDIAGHGRMCVYSYSGGAYNLDSSDIVFHSGQKLPANTPYRVVRAFLQALDLGENSEALEYISPSYLRAVSIEDMRGFLGAYDGFVDAKYFTSAPRGEMIGLYTYTAERFRNVRLFSFELSDGKISKIEQYT